MTNVAVYSLQPVLLQGLQSVLASAEEMRVAVASSDLRGFLEALTANPCDAALLEASPEVTLSVLHHIRTTAGVPVVLWVDTVAVEFLSQVIGLGVRGIVAKTMPTSTVVECVRKVASGDLWVEKSLCDRLLQTRRYTLTRREQQLMALLAEGLKNKEIAYSLGITEGTVKVYLSRLFQKVGANDRFDLALIALRNLAAMPQSVPQRGTGTGARDAGGAGPRPSFLPILVNSTRPAA